MDANRAKRQAIYLKERQKLYIDTDIKVEVDKAYLVATLEANLESHRSIYNEAIAGWRAVAVEQLGEFVESIEKKIADGGPATDYFREPIRPVDHSDEYELVLGMLALAQDTTLVITASDYQKFIKDDWDWKQEFAGTTSNYR